MAELVLDGLAKRYGNTIAVDGLALSVREGELLTLLGPSGSGKTTVLRLVAGFLAPDAGRIVVAGREVQDLPPEKRDVGMVFQSYALFPHRSVARNVAFGLERRGVAPAERARRVREILEKVRLVELAERFPGELSGGQQQRVALARALVIEPTLLLLDEPLSSLDARLRDELRREIRRLQQELSITTVLVTHDQEEAITISDRIALLHRGRLQQLGTPRELYDRPTNRFVAEFLGKVNLLAATRVDREGERARYRLSGGELVLGPDGDGHESVLLAVRPEAIRLSAPVDPSGSNRLSTVLRARRFLGEVHELELALADGTSLRVRGSDLRQGPREAGAPVEIFWPVERTWRLDADGEAG